MKVIKQPSTHKVFRFHYICIGAICINDIGVMFAFVATYSPEFSSKHGCGWMQNSELFSG